MNRSFPFGALLVIVCSFFLGAITTYGLVQAARIAKPAEKTPVETITISDFQRYYVGLQSLSARIPFKFCLPLYPDEDFTAVCGSSTESIEIDLKKHSLPVDRILSAVTNGQEIIYALNVGRRDNGCFVPDLFSYNLATKVTRQLKNDPSIWTCGATRSQLFSLSPSGRYLEVVTVGVGPSTRWTYDTTKDQIDGDLADAPYVYVFSPGEDTSANDIYTLFIDGCLNESMGCTKVQTLKVRNNESRISARLTSIEQQLKQQNIALSDSRCITCTPSTNELRLSSNDMGQELIVKNFRSLLP